MANPILDVLAGKRHWPPPIWVMRQAGRYLPEYRELREKAGSFLGLCQNPALATEVTLQPVRRYGFDAAILFSDILIVPLALGQAVRFEEGEGPRLDPVSTLAALDRLRTEPAEEAIAPTIETVRRVRKALPAETALLGFCGAPWTVATYMVAGRGSADQQVARMTAYGDPTLFAAIIERLVGASITYLAAQLKAGADAVQIFDTWAGVLPDAEFDRWVIGPTRKIVQGVRALVPGARIIGFPRGGGARLKRYAIETGVDTVGVDWTADAAFVRAEVQSRVPVQGNIDPLALLAGGAALDAAVDQAIAAFGKAPWVFNLGHGILRETPLAHVSQMIARVRAAPDPC